MIKELCFDYEVNENNIIVKLDDKKLLLNLPKNIILTIESKCGMEQRDFSAGVAYAFVSDKAKNLYIEEYLKLINSVIFKNKDLSVLDCSSNSELINIATNNFFDVSFNSAVNQNKYLLSKKDIAVESRGIDIQNNDNFSALIRYFGVIENKEKYLCDILDGFGFKLDIDLIALPCIRDKNYFVSVNLNTWSSFVENYYDSLEQKRILDLILDNPQSEILKNNKKLKI